MPSAYYRAVPETYISLTWLTHSTVIVGCETIQSCIKLHLIKEVVQEAGVGKEFAAHSIRGVATTAVVMK